MRLRLWHTDNRQESAAAVWYADVGRAVRREYKQYVNRTGFVIASREWVSQACE